MSAASEPLPGRKRSREALYAPFERARVLSIVTGLSAVALVAGWMLRDERYQVPDRGLGYALGIVGLSLMGLLLLYPLRKRLAFARSWGRLDRWFHVHMVLGVLGPLAILFHANFRLGSLNARVALISMLVVSGSGFVGRFIYTRVHHGLFGSRSALLRFRERLEAERLEMGRTAPALAEALGALDALAAERAVGLGDALGRSLRARRLAGRIRRQARGGALVPRRRAALDAQLGALQRVASFAVWERLFALWHALHLPLSLTLFAAAAVHVVAVHLY